MKQIAYYKTDSDPTIGLLHDILGKPFWYAKLDVINHPLLGSGLVRTSEIVSFNSQGGIIETKNTVYMPMPEGYTSWS